MRALTSARAAVETLGRTAIAHANEAAMLMSAVAMAPLRLARHRYNDAGIQPVRTTPTARPVLLVHGFGGTRSSWVLVTEALSARGMTVAAMAYSPVGTSVPQLADQLIREVEALLARTGADKVDLVGHSLGGVVIGQAVGDARLSGRVNTVITLGSPFGGSPWADALPILEIVRALRTGSPVLRRLAFAPPPSGVRWLSFTAELDIIVPGRRSVPSHVTVETISFDGVGHLGMLVSRRVIGCIAAALCPEQYAPGGPAAAAA
jgi:triacylglycerol esterase/lipase EstA (alpha/beta hydrolase family)